VLISKSDSFQKKGTAFFPGSSLAGEGLLVSDGDVWSRQRRLSNPAFRQAAVSGPGWARGRGAPLAPLGPRDPHGPAPAPGRRRAPRPESHPPPTRDARRPTPDARGPGPRPPAPQVATYADAIVGVSGGFLRRRWRRGGLRDVYADFNELTLEIVASTLFGADMRGAAAGRITGAIRAAFEFFAARAATGFAVPEWVPTPGNLRYGAAVAELDEVVYGLIRERRAAAAAGAPPGDDLLGRLLSARDEEGDGDGMSTRALRDELMTLLVAGQETSAIVLAWACHLLAGDPGWQRRCADEAAAALAGRPAGDLGPSDLPALAATQAAVLEAMRLLPPAYLVGRCARRDVDVAGFRVPAGTTVLPSPYLLHRDPRHWDAPAEFRPSRWEGPLADAGGAAARVCAGMGPGGAYVPFGAGPRNCIGAGFALLETSLVLARVVSDYEVRPGGRFSRPVEPAPVITLRPGTVELEVVPRAGARGARAGA